MNDSIDAEWSDADNDDLDLLANSVFGGSFVGEGRESATEED